MIILASIGGIQDFLFDTLDGGGDQAQSLRHRSFRIQILAECVAIRLLDAAGVSKEKLLFCAAAKLAIDATSLTPESISAVRSTLSEIETCLLNETNGRLRLAFAIQESAETFAATMRLAERALARSKLRAHAPCGTNESWSAGSLIVDKPWDAAAEAELDSQLGNDLSNIKWFTIEREDVESENQGAPCVGVRVRLGQAVPRPSPILLSCSNLVAPDSQPANVHGNLFHRRTLGRHIPRAESGNPVEFAEIARASRGAAMLGVLKVDVDSFAAAASAAAAAGGAVSLRKLSAGIDGFFAETVEAEMCKPNSPWSNIYTVFSGGDDLLAVGPWDLMIDFAAHLHSMFQNEFGTGASSSPSRLPLTISAGLSIIKPRYPMHLAAQQAEELLVYTKTLCARGAKVPKNQFAVLGDLWKWGDHIRIVSECKQLADWIDAGFVRRSWLKTILDLNEVDSSTATYKLAYHVQRDWPRKGPARAWIDHVAKSFGADSQRISAIIQYAMLATRSGNLGDDQ